MKKKSLILLVFVCLFMTGCYERDIIDDKFGESVEPITGLSYLIAGSDVIFNWNLPTSYPNDLTLPVSVVVTIFVNDINVGSETLGGAPTAYTYSSYSASENYRFIFKVRGNVETDDPNVSPVRYSLGIVEEL